MTSTYSHINHLEADSPCALVRAVVLRLGSRLGNESFDGICSVVEEVDGCGLWARWVKSVVGYEDYAWRESVGDGTERV